MSIRDEITITYAEELDTIKVAGKTFASPVVKGKKKKLSDGRTEQTVVAIKDKSESKTVRDYGAFLGRQKGVENIPLEKAPSNYWNRLSRKDKPIFHKIVGLNDKITIAEHKSNQENPEKQVENKPTGNSNSQPKELNDKTLLQYFQQKNIKSIKIENEKLIIKYNGSQTETKDINNLELEQIKSFAEKIGKNELSLADLEQKNNQSNTPDKSNKGIYISLAIGGALAIAIIAYFLLRNKKEK
ncbi:8081_t:CDS:2 [Ambispora leptoticha]|uniref:8081_t:CDS:1 n=1 Tax=Ambispora leptoticha TaxID=144679 RepID=A0A9N9EDZ5_9GLOM|nr:8081_t:CDS:2 [Ambispora leptoticha]